MDIQLAAERTLEMVEPEGPSRDDDGRTVAHAIWMLQGIVEGYIQYEKAHRWLGYAQAILVVAGRAELGQMKHANRTPVPRKPK